MTEPQKTSEEYTLILGHEVPNRLLDKAGPFCLGMLTTYVLQMMLPIIFHYTLATARVLKIIFIWLAITAVVCWYTGILNPQLMDMQSSVADIYSRFTEKGSRTKNHSSVPRTSRSPTVPDVSHREKAEFQKYRQIQKSSKSLEDTKSPRSRSPVRKSDTANLPYISTYISKQETKPAIESQNIEDNSPTINVRPFLAQRRDGVRSSQFDVKSTPNSSAPSIFTVNSGETNRTRTNSEYTLETDRKITSFPRKLTSPSHLEDFPKLALFDARRNSADTLNTTGTNKSNKPLPAISNAVGSEFSNDHQNLGNARDNYQADQEKKHRLKREDSVASKSSVLGTRANYSKFLANVGR